MMRRRKEPRFSNTVRLDAADLALVLGDLEARLMRILWDVAEPCTAREVHELVVREHEVQLLTVVTVLNNLVCKGLLSRRRRGVLHYEARLMEHEFRAQVARRVMEGVLPFGPAAMAASLVDVLAETDPRCLADLAELVRLKLAGRGKA